MWLWNVHWKITAFQTVKKSVADNNKKHLKNVGPIRHNELPHANSPDVASGTVMRRLRIDIHDNDDDDNTWQGTAMAPWNGPN